MASFVALLRGVNVGRGQRVPMAALRALLTELGYTGIVTVLNSGNAIFRASKGSPASHAANIAAAISAELKVEVPVLVESAKELAAIVAENMLASAAVDPSRLLVAFVQDRKALSGLASVAALVSPPERFLIGKNAAYLLCPSGTLESKAWEALLGKAGKSATTRNWATVLKLHAAANEPEG